MKKLYRSKKEKMFFGVCGGIARYFGVDVTLIRLAFVIFTLVFGLGLLGLPTYIISAIIIPIEPDYIEANYKDV